MEESNSLMYSVRWTAAACSVVSSTTGVNTKSCPESKSNTSEVRKLHNTIYFKKICDDALGIEVDIISTTRLDAKKPGNDKPLRVELADNRSKSRVLRNAASKDEYLWEVFIIKDITFLDRQEHRKLRQDLRAKWDQAKEAGGETQVNHSTRKADKTKGQQHRARRPSSRWRGRNNHRHNSETGGTGDGHSPGDGGKQQLSHPQKNIANVRNRNTKNVRNLVCLYTNTDCLFSYWTSILSYKL